jgi:ATP-dependent DNA ligase
MNELRRRVRAEQSFPRFEPCLPRPASEPPAGAGWIHEIKHDGFRILAHRRGRSVRLITRNGHDLADRFPLAAEAIEALPVRSCLIDGEAIVCDDNGLAVFQLIRGHGTNARAILCAFDLLEVNGEDIRREPIEAERCGCPIETWLIFGNGARRASNPAKKTSPTREKLSRCYRPSRRLHARSFAARS